MTSDFNFISSLLLIFVLFTLLNSTAVFAEKINLNETLFSIMPENITQNTLIVLENLVQEIDLSLHRLDEQRYLLIYGGRFYLLNVDSRIVKAENGEFELPEKTALINNKLLVPVYLLELLPEIEVTGLKN